jgi:outer membrane lipoprotein-sorting protein
MRIFDSKPALRLLAPLALLLVVIGTGLVTATASAEKKLPTRTPQELLVDLQQARTDGLTGTVVERADLGIPAIPGVDGRDDPELSALVSGTHTLRVRYSAPDKARLAILGTYSEYDIIRNGKDAWTWSSKENAATHRTVTADQTGGEPGSTPSATPRTPEEAASQVLKALEPTTIVTSDSSVEVAGRPAYELVLDPNDSNTLISQVRIAIDGDTKVPLRVQAFGTDSKILFEVAYTSVEFTRPDDAEFVFNPPPGAKVTEIQPSDQTPPSAQDRKQAEEARKATTVVGTGWTAVAITKVGDPSTSEADQQLKAFLNRLQPVHGSWGSGRLLAGTALSAVWTDDGRLAVGAVRPDLIYQALSR